MTSLLHVVGQQRAFIEPASYCIFFCWCNTSGQLCQALNKKMLLTWYRCDESAICTITIKLLRLLTAFIRVQCFLSMGWNMSTRKKRICTKEWHMQLGGRHVWWSDVFLQIRWITNGILPICKQHPLFHNFSFYMPAANEWEPRLYKVEIKSTTLSFHSYPFPSSSFPSCHFLDTHCKCPRVILSP